MARHPFLDALIPLAGDAAADAISEAVEQHAALVALDATDITARDLARTKVVILLTVAGYAVYKHDPANMDPEDGDLVILDSEDRPFVKIFAGADLAALLTTRGDLVRRGVSAPERLALGAAQALLKSDGTDAVWGAAGQIAFPSAQNASADPNTLDDYEEGSFTPTITFGGAAVGLTYASQAGRYTKIGRLVVAEINVALSSKGTSTGAAQIEGLPFTPGQSFGVVGFFDNFVPGAGNIPQLASSGAVLLFRLLNQSTGTNGAATDAAFANNTAVRATVAYSV